MDLCWHARSNFIEPIHPKCRLHDTYYHENRVQSTGSSTIAAIYPDFSVGTYILLHSRRRLPIEGPHSPSDDFSDDGDCSWLDYLQLSWLRNVLCFSCFKDISRHFIFFLLFFRRPTFLTPLYFTSHGFFFLLHLQVYIFLVRKDTMTSVMCTIFPNCIYGDLQYFREKICLIPRFRSFTIWIW